MKNENNILIKIYDQTLTLKIKDDEFYVESDNGVTNLESLHVAWLLIEDQRIRMNNMFTPFLGGVESFGDKNIKYISEQIDKVLEEIDCLTRLVENMGENYVARCKIAQKDFSKIIEIFSKVKNLKRKNFVFSVDRTKT